MRGGYVVCREVLRIVERAGRVDHLSNKASYLQRFHHEGCCNPGDAMALSFETLQQCLAWRWSLGGAEHKVFSP